MNSGISVLKTNTNLLQKLLSIHHSCDYRHMAGVKMICEALIKNKFFALKFYNRPFKE